LNRADGRGTSAQELADISCLPIAVTDRRTQI
jgi:hypothetical protein